MKSRWAGVGVLIGAVIVLAGIVVAATGVGLLVGILVVVAGLAVVTIVFGLDLLFSLTRSLREWKELLTSGARYVRLVSAEPPKGFLLNRDTTLTFEIESKEGHRKQLDRTIPVPIPQAFLWRVAGRVPTPIGRLTDKRTIDKVLWKRRGDRIGPG